MKFHFTHFILKVIFLFYVLHTDIHANPEAPGMYDARNLGMGGAGVAHINSPAAALHNPANLATIKKTQHQGHATALIVNFEGSFSGAGNEQESGWNPVALPFVGFSTSISENIVVGSAFYLALGFGGGFQDVKQYGTGEPCTKDITDIFTSPKTGGFILDTSKANNDYCIDEGRDELVELGLLELAIPIAYNVSDKFRIGISLRFPFGLFSQQTSQDIFGAANNPNNPSGTYGLGMAQVSSDMFGFGDPGYLVGFTYDIYPFLSVAATYRSEVTVTMEGETNVDLNSNKVLKELMSISGALPIGVLSDIVNNIEGIGPLLDLLPNDNVSSFASRLTSDIDSEISWSIPRAIEAGFALQISPKTLLAVDWRHQYHSESNKDFIVKLNEPIFAVAGLDALGQQLNWSDVSIWSAGIEHAFSYDKKLRLGYSFGNSATPEAYTNGFTPPPAKEQSAIYIGYGYENKHWKYDVGFSYAKVEHVIDQPLDAAGNEVPTSTCRAGQLVKSGCPGYQSVTSIFLGLSAIYQY